MEQKWIIIKMQFRDNKNINYIEDLAVCDQDKNLIVFNTIEDAFLYQEDNFIDGICTELPLY